MVVLQETKKTPNANNGYVKIHPMKKNFFNDAPIVAPSPLIEMLELDPHQMVILSGPFPSSDDKRSIMIARKVPLGKISTKLFSQVMFILVLGYTVIAKPAIGAQLNPLILQQDQFSIVDPESCSPKLPRDSPTETEKVPASTDKSMTNPMVMMWNAEYPDGRLVPLRQPAPPVYFQQASSTSSH